MTRGLRIAVTSFVVVLLVALGAVVGLFLVQNAQWVVLRAPWLRFRLDDPFLVAEYETPLYAVMAAAFVVGFALAVLLFIPFWLRRSVERGRERRFVRGLEEELTDLRNLPVDHPAPLEDEPDQPRESSPPPPSAEEEERALLAAALQDPTGKGTAR
jgi:uncharacterized membrane protein YciS (DUF1049 family)